MKIFASVSLANVTPSVIIEHLGQTLSFSISFYRRTVFSGDMDVFSQINDYWADQTPEVQQTIFNIYRNILNSFDDIGYTKQTLREFLQEQVKELLSYHDLVKVQEWIAFKAIDIKLPLSIPNEFIVDVDRNTSSGKTYIASDYRRLTTLSLVLRCMIPIWGEYISSIKQETDDSFKEMLAFQLVDKVLNAEVPAVKKLMNYIDNTIHSANLTRQMNVFKGIPTSDYPRWLLALVCIRCLATGDIRGVNPEAHLVTFMYMFISGRLSTKDDTGDSKIKNKEIDDTMDENTARASALERYKIKANIAIGDIVEIEYFLSDLFRVGQYLSPGIDHNDVLRCVEHMKDYEGLTTEPQVTLLRWIFRSIVSQKIIHYLPDQLLKQLMGVAEAVLWRRGHHYLSLLITSHPIRSDKEMVVSTVDSKMRIAEPLIEQLDVLYTYRRSQRIKKADNRGANLAMESIDRLTNNLMTYGWRPTTEIDRVEQVLGYRTMRYPIKPDIKTDLARLVIEIQSRNNLHPTPLFK